MWEAGGVKSTVDFFFSGPEDAALLDELFEIRYLDRIISHLTSS